MALHDFRCPACGTILRDVNVPVDVGATRGAPDCPHACRRGEPQALPVQMVPIPAVGRMDASGGSGFTAFTARDGQNREVYIDSLSKLRSVERQSEADAKNGLGQPIRFRLWSNDRSNRDQNTFGPPPAESPTRAAVEKFGPAARSSTDPDYAYGPGVDDSNTSAFAGDSDGRDQS